MHKIKISISLFFFLLGSLACMQSAPSATPTRLPTTAARAYREAQASGSIDCTVNTHALNVRDCGGFDCAIVGWLEAEQSVKAERSSGSAWLKITRGNLSGYARADYLTCKK